MMVREAESSSQRRRKKKKKGQYCRPAPWTTDPLAEAAPRRNLRPRRRSLLVDYDEEEEDEEEEEEEEDERGRRKLKLVVKLSQGHNKRSSCTQEEEQVANEDEDDIEAVKPLKKRRIEIEHSSLTRLSLPSTVLKDHLPHTKKNAGRKSTPNAPDKLFKLPVRTPLPEKKALQEVLDKLQKKDVYGVFAQPVDPEELPDYHDVIEHPMDFATIRKKLSCNVYHCFEQFEDDVFLICSNAMQYNAPDTVYFRQAHSIQEMARKKFQLQRDEARSIPSKGKPAEKIKLSPVERLIRNPMGVDSQDAIVSGVSAADTDSALEMDLPSSVRGPVNDELYVDDDSLSSETKLDKSCYSEPAIEDDDGSGNRSPTKSSEKLMSLNIDHLETDDGNFDKESIMEIDLASPMSSNCSPSNEVPFMDHRDTYTTFSEFPVNEFGTFLNAMDEEMKLLTPIELHHSEYAYAKSLASFAGPLGPKVWRIAAEKIEKVLPSGIKFGPGWVGEYQSLPNSIFPIGNHSNVHLGKTPNLKHVTLSKGEDNQRMTTNTFHTNGNDTPISLFTSCLIKREDIASTDIKDNYTKEIQNAESEERTSKSSQSFANRRRKDSVKNKKTLIEDMPKSKKRIGRKKLHDSVHAQAAERMENKPPINSFHGSFSVSFEAKKNPINAQFPPQNARTANGFAASVANNAEKFKIGGSTFVSSTLQGSLRPDYFSSNIHNIHPEHQKRFGGHIEERTGGRPRQVHDSCVFDSEIIVRRDTNENLATSYTMSSSCASTSTVTSKEGFSSFNEANHSGHGLVIFPQLMRSDFDFPWQATVSHFQKTKTQMRDLQAPDLNISFQPPPSPVQDTQQPDLALQL